MKSQRNLKVLFQKRIVFFILSFVVFTLGAQRTIVIGQEENSNLKLVVSLEKEEFAVGEPIIMTAKITNTGLEPITDNWFEFGRLSFRIVEEGMLGGAVRLSGSHGPTGGGWWYGLLGSLLPGESVTTAYDVIFGDVLAMWSRTATGRDVSPEETSKVEQFIYKLGTGKYTLEVSHTLPTSVLRATAKFKIRDVTVREKEALTYQLDPKLVGDKADNDGFTIVKGSNPNLQAQEAIKSYKVILDQYGDTVYARHALFYLARLLQIAGNYTDAVSRYEELLTKYPDFPLKPDVMFYIAECLAKSGATEQAKSKGYELFTKYPKHLVTPGVIYKGDNTRVQALLKKLETP